MTSQGVRYVASLIEAVQKSLCLRQEELKNYTFQTVQIDANKRQFIEERIRPMPNTDAEADAWVRKEFPKDAESIIKHAYWIVEKKNQRDAAAKKIKRNAGERPTYAPSEKVTIEDVMQTVHKNFPGTEFVTTTCLSFNATILLEDLHDPMGLNLEGAPSSEKTTVLSFFYGIEGITYKSDLFTPRSFVTHSANIPNEELEEIDLLPKIRYKTFLVPELAPIFGKRREDLIENLSVLTRLFDGEGLETDSGSRGHRGYTGEYPFVWIGATTPLPTHVWNTMGKLGQRFFFLKIPEKNKTVDSLREMMQHTSYKEKIKECMQIVHKFVRYQFGKAGSPLSIKWDKQNDDVQVLNYIIGIAQLLVRLRAPIELYAEKFGEEKNEYQFKTPVREEPERAIMLLYNLARGHAILHERTHLTLDDVPVVASVALGSCPFERYKLLQLFESEKYILNSDEVALKLNCSDRNARTILKTLEILDLGKIETFNEQVKTGGRPKHQFTLKKEYSELLTKLKSFGSQTDKVREAQTTTNQNIGTR